MQARDPTASWLRVPHPKCNGTNYQRKLAKGLTTVQLPFAHGQQLPPLNDSGHLARDQATSCRGVWSQIKYSH
jgi:hypothetical protein